MPLIGPNRPVGQVRGFGTGRDRHVSPSPSPCLCPPCPCRGWACGWFSPGLLVRGLSRVRRAEGLRCLVRCSVDGSRVSYLRPARPSLRRLWHRGSSGITRGAYTTVLQQALPRFPLASSWGRVSGCGPIPAVAGQARRVDASDAGDAPRATTRPAIAGRAVGVGGRGRLASPPGSRRPCPGCRPRPRRSTAPSRPR